MNALAPVLIRKPLSGIGGQWEVEPHLQQKACLTDDGILHIVNGYEADAFLLAFEHRLTRAGVTFERDYVTSEQLHALYAEIGSTSSSNRANTLSRIDISDKQKEIKAIFSRAVAAGASDVHFFPTPKGHELRFRVHGVLETAQNFVGDDGTTLLSSLYSSMCESTDVNFRPEIPQDARLKAEFVSECGLFGARVMTRPTLNGTWMAIRLLYDSGLSPELEDMGYLPAQIEALKRFIHRTDGIVLVTGTTGSGKSTLLQKLLKLALADADFTINLVTIEDPVEYRIPGAQQTPLSALGWAGDIANLLRGDPDVLMVGEMRDTQSAAAGFQGALTGHGLWSTGHTRDALTGIQRLLELGIDINLVLDPSLMKGLMNQALTPVLCNACKIPYLPNQHTVSTDLQQRIAQRCQAENVYLKGLGCPACKGRGVTGRTAIAEIVSPTLELMRVYREKGKAEAHAYWVNAMGGITKNAHLLQRINEGIVDPRLGEKDVCSLDEDLLIVGGL
jgi:type II secretory ATPase GspE/PulE/Tfp pilus assembly ATPase PilB-like protein